MADIVQQTGQWTSAGVLLEHDLPTRTHQTVPLEPLAVVPSWFVLPLVKRIESTVHIPINQEFFDKISPDLPLQEHAPTSALFLAADMQFFE